VASIGGGRHRRECRSDCGCCPAYDDRAATRLLEMVPASARTSLRGDYSGPAAGASSPQVGLTSTCRPIERRTFDAASAYGSSAAFGGAPSVGVQSRRR
jgi:hypothetical protein